MSWLIQRDVDEGRRKLNYSEWNRGQKEARESAKTVNKREMPPWFYLPLHPTAQLSQTEKDELISGLVATFGDRQERGEGARPGAGRGRD